MQKLILFSIIIFSIFLVSCEKELKIPLKQGDSLMVVEGSIETDQYPVLTLTKSVGFFNTIDFNAVKYYNGAIVTVTDLNTNETITLKEYAIDTVISGQHFAFSGYTIDFLNTQHLAFKGKNEHRYKLVIDVDGRHAESITKIPQPAGIDSLYTINAPGFEDSFSVIKGYLKDPDTLGNYIKYQTQNKQYLKDNSNAQFYSPFNYLFDDKIVNGTKFPITLDIGRDPNEKSIDFNTYGLMHHGDTATIKWMSIDNKTYNFWNTLEFAKGSVGNPFSSPIQVESNVTGALGIWGGYGVIHYTIIDSL